MKSFLKFLLIATVAVGAVLSIASPSWADGRGGGSPVGPTIAEPARPASMVVYVDVQPSASANWYWAIRNGTTFVDSYTTSDMRFGACRRGFKCIRVRERWYSNRWAAVTAIKSRYNVWIELNPQYRHSGYNYKKRIVEHEMGHANGVWGHNPKPTSVMFHAPSNGGRLTPETFTYNERVYLREN